MADWTAPLRSDPLPALLSSEHKAVRYFARRDLLLEDPGPIDSLWTLPAAQATLKRQQKDGSWWDFPLYDYHQPYGTAFALMTLQRTRRATP